ncbi:MAG: response regulator [Crocinitomicaceae bacterium]|nr:response regulator [Crocinitomicaceae bacterium]
MKILIIEDEFIVAAYLRKFLVKHGHEVIGITDDYKSSVEALELEPDLCLVDIRLSRGDSGIDVAKVILEKEIPFAFVSANNEKDTLTQARMTNPISFIPKPVREKEILDLIESIQN